MSTTTTILLIGAAGVAVFLVVRATSAPVKPATNVWDVTGSLIGNFGSWWSANYEFGSSDSPSGDQSTTSTKDWLAANSAGL